MASSKVRSLGYDEAALAGAQDLPIWEEQESGADEPDCEAVEVDAEPAAPTAAENLKSLLGISDPDIIQRINIDLGTLTPDDGVSSKNALEGLIVVLRGVAPKNMVETMLALQMGVVHRATIKHASALHQVDTAAELELFQKGLMKLAKTFTAQVDALQRLRGEGTRTMRIERVNVSDGGQAIIGTVGGGSSEK